MTASSDREVFLNEVREALEQKLRKAKCWDNIGGDPHHWGLDGSIVTTELAQAAIDAMVRRMGPLF